MMISKPMLAETCEDINSLVFPVLATPKLDGIRCVKVNGVAMSRKFIAIPNLYIQKHISGIAASDLDGEIMIPGATFNQTQSTVMRADGEPRFEYHVFDYVSAGITQPYSKRMEVLKELELPAWCVRILPRVINSPEELMVYEAECLSDGYEGVMIRSPNSPYKLGRSTVRESYLLKIKRFSDSEACVLGFEERMHNANEATKDELGHTKRSSHKANMVPTDTLGAFVVRDIHNGKEFKVATGLDDAYRKHIWQNKDNYLGKVLKYKYQPSGMKDLPRFPVFVGFRDIRDI